MTYTGKVRPGGPADVRELPGLMISKISVGPMDNEAYLLRCRQTDEQLLVDAAEEEDRLLDLVGPDGLVGVVTTHRHADHWQALGGRGEGHRGQDLRAPAGRSRHPGRDRTSSSRTATGSGSARSS